MSVGKNKRIILIGVIAVILYWTIDSIIMSGVLQKGDFIEQFFYPGGYELWMRTVTVLILFALFPLGQYILATRKTTMVKPESGLHPIFARRKKLEMKRDIGNL